MNQRLTSPQAIQEFQQELAKEMRELAEKKGRLIILEREIRDEKILLAQKEKEFRLLRSEVEHCEHDAKGKQRDLENLTKQLKEMERMKRKV